MSDVVNCDCEEWKKSMKILTTCTSISHIKGYDYTGAIFKYCPWCGERLFDTKGVLPND